MPSLESEVVEVPVDTARETRGWSNASLALRKIYEEVTNERDQKAAYEKGRSCSFTRQQKTITGAFYTPGYPFPRTAGTRTHEATDR